MDGTSEQQNKKRWKHYDNTKVFQSQKTSGDMDEKGLYNNRNGSTLCWRRRQIKADKTMPDNLKDERLHNFQHRKTVKPARMLIWIIGSWCQTAILSKKDEKPSLNIPKTVIK